jgi:hypothetical protein
MLIERRDPGDAERIASLLDEAEAVAGEIGALLDLVALGRARAGLHELRGESDARERALAESLELARRIDARGLIAELEAETGARSASFGSGVTR